MALECICGGPYWNGGGGGEAFIQASYVNQIQVACVNEKLLPCSSGASSISKH